MDFRSQPLDDEQIREAEGLDDPGELLGVYMLETDFGEEDTGKKRWGRCEKKRAVGKRCPGGINMPPHARQIWDDLEYFPVAQSSNRKNLTVSFVDSWMYDRNYGGSRGHEGTDIMPSENKSELYPVVSMTDGTVRSMGWLELGDGVSESTLRAALTFIMRIFPPMLT